MTVFRPDLLSESNAGPLMCLERSSDQGRSSGLRRRLSLTENTNTPAADMGLEGGCVMRLFEGTILSSSLAILGHIVHLIGLQVTKR